MAWGARGPNGPSMRGPGCGWWLTRRQPPEAGSRWWQQWWFGVVAAPTGPPGIQRGVDRQDAQMTARIILRVRMAEAGGAT